MTTPTRPIFRVAGIATLKHLNIRKEGPDDEKILAVDVKLAFEKIDGVLCAYFDDALEAFLWRDDAMIVRNAFMQPIAYLNELSGATVTIETATFRGCEVKKFAIQPRDGGVIDLVCSVALYEPTADEIGDLSRRLQDGARVAIEGPQDLFDGAVERAHELTMPAETMHPTATMPPAGVGQLDGRVMAPVPKRDGARVGERCRRAGRPAQAWIRRRRTLPPLRALWPRSGSERGRAWQPQTAGRSCVAGQVALLGGAHGAVLAAHEIDQLGAVAVGEGAAARRQAGAELLVAVVADVAGPAFAGDRRPDVHFDFLVGVQRRELDRDVAVVVRGDRGLGHLSLPVQAPRHAEPMSSNVRMLRTLRKRDFLGANPKRHNVRAERLATAPR